MRKPATITPSFAGDADIFFDLHRSVLPGSRPRLPEATTSCPNASQRRALDCDRAVDFADRVGPDTLAVMMSAKSCAPHDIRQAAVRRCAELVRAR